MKDLSPTYILNKTVEKMAYDRAEWIDSTIAMWVPAWRLKLIKKFPSKLLYRILVGEIEIINEQLIGNFGTRVWVKWNRFVIGSKNFKY